MSEEESILAQYGKAPVDILMELFALDYFLKKKDSACVWVWHKDPQGVARTGYRWVTKALYERLKPSVSITDTRPRKIILDFGNQPEGFPNIKGA